MRIDGQNFDTGAKNYCGPSLEERMLAVESEVGLVPSPSNPLVKGIEAKISARTDPLASQIVAMNEEWKNSLGRLVERVTDLEIMLDTVHDILQSPQKSPTWRERFARRLHDLADYFDRN